MFESRNAASWLLDSAPTFVASGSPFLNKMSVGMPRILNFSVASRWSSTLSFAIVKRPAYSVASSSKTGAIILHGPHHIIFFVDDNEQFEIEKIGPKIENHKLFPEKCNVTIATIINKELIKVKVWERGAGLTKACGTAACATAYAAKQAGLASDKVNIEFSTGRLTISIDENNSIHMKGPVSDIKEIDIEI